MHEFGAGLKAVAAEWDDSGERDFAQCWKELKALQYCIEAECKLLVGKTVLVRPDASTTVAYVNKGSGPSKTLTAIMRRIWDVCVEHSIGLRAEHLKGEKMIVTGTDSLSRMAEFSVAPSVFRHLHKMDGFGRRRGHKGYSFDLYASKKTKKCAKWASRNAVDGAVGDARVIKLAHTENHWVVPPIAMIPIVVQHVLDAQVPATIVVPDWPDKPWHVMLRLKAKRYEFLRWHEKSPVMLDVCVKSAQHPHLVDKWDFVAFAVGGSEPIWGLGLWRPRFKTAVNGQNRRKVEPKLWKPQALKRRRKEVAAGSAVRVLDCSAVGSGSTATQVQQRHLGVRHGVRRKRTLRVLSLCNGCGAASLALKALQQQYGTQVEVVVVEIDPICRAFTKWRFPEELQGWSGDVLDWAADAFTPEAHGKAFWFDLVIAGFPCQDLSSAHKQGSGLQGGKSALFYKVWKVVQKMRLVNTELDFILECVDFREKHPEDFTKVIEVTGVQPLILCASRIAPCYRRRAFWVSYEVQPLVSVVAEPWQVLEAGRWTDWTKLPTIMASGTKSWNTAQVVFDESRRQQGTELEKSPLFTVEMERSMGMPDGFTDMEGLEETKRHHMIGNSFHVGIIQHVIRWWMVKVQDFDATAGYPGEGPLKRDRKRRRVYDVLDSGEDRRRKLLHQQAAPVESASMKAAPSSKLRNKPSAKSGRREAAWRGVVPQMQQPIRGLNLADVWDSGGWGSSDRLVLGRFATAKKVKVPTGAGFNEFIRKIQHDLILGARSDNTRKAYVAWVEVFAGWLDMYGLTVEVSRQQQGCAVIWEQWIEVLCAAIACLSTCYSAGTVSIFVSAVSAYMQDFGFRSPFEHRFLSRLYAGMIRFLGAGKKKKPPVEAKHVAAILKYGRVLHAKGFTVLQFAQAIALFIVGWQLFNRAQDFEEFQICDFTFLDKGLRVLVRRAKNDVKGMTRSPVLEYAELADGCPVRLLHRYFEAAGIRIADGCNKQQDSPHRCLACPPAFPAIHKHAGKQPGRGQERMGMPKARVTEVVRGLYVGLAVVGAMGMEEALAFSAKSLRCGGVSEAAGQAIRDGVTQAHGGWLVRQSLVHYDLARPDEAFDVSHALNGATAKCLEEIGLSE